MARVDSSQNYGSDCLIAVRTLEDRACLSAIEAVLLRNVVLRFRKGIETQHRSDVLVEDVDYLAEDKWMSKCFSYAHIQALAGGVEVPEPDELLADIVVLDDWRKDTEKRSVGVQKKRKSGL